MGLTTETLLEEKWRQGKSFFWLHSSLVLTASGTDEIVIKNGKEETAIVGIHLESNSEILNWEAFAGAIVTDATGTEILALPRNSNAASKIEAQVIFNPTVTNDGLPFFASPIDIVAQVAAGNRAYIQEDLITSIFSLKPNTNYLIKIKNNDVLTRKYNMTIDMIVE